VRGDQQQILIGKNSIIQDNSLLFNSNTQSKNNKLDIGDNVYVGPNATLDSCTLESFSYVGMGASIGKGSIVESFAVVAAGAVIPPGTTVPSG
jgi:carbonic anhydrase/acetyltransferase-like protein (isoleucine patch superfamily)